MKKISIVCFLLFSSIVHADSLTKEETCQGWANKAEQFMEVRQNNVPIHEAMKMTVGNFSRGLMLRAYNEPVAENEGEKQVVIDHFAEIIEDECLKNAQ
jgi:hypothetical protein